MKTIAPTATSACDGDNHLFQVRQVLLDLLVILGQCWIVGRGGRISATGRGLR